jgi:threonine synthase
MIEYCIQSTVCSVLITELTCLRCGHRQAERPDSYLCDICGTGSAPSDAGVLDVGYDYDAAAAQLRDLAGTRDDVFRWAPVLPVDGTPAVLRTGGTPILELPLIAAEVGAARVVAKDETRNATRSLKDRATAVATARALAHGATDVYCASAGNAAISMAAFAAHAGLEAHAFIPHDASETRLDWLQRFGADIRRSGGDYGQAYDEAEEQRAKGWYSRNCAFNPFLVEGKKTAALELAEQLDWQPPDFVICAVGDACTLAAIGKGFREAREMGFTDRLPRLIGVQSAACQPLVPQDGPSALVAEAEPSTLAASIDVTEPRNRRRLVAELDASDGLMISVGDGEIATAQRDLARRSGAVVEFTSAAPLAALRRLAAHEPLAGATVALVMTGGRPDPNA